MQQFRFRFLNNHEKKDYIDGIPADFIIQCNWMFLSSKNSKNNNSLPVSDQKITAEDINEGKQVIRDHVNALKSGNLEDLNKTLGRYQQGFYKKVRIGNSTLEIDTIE